LDVATGGINRFEIISLFNVIFNQPVVDSYIKKSVNFRDY
jgi:hypothetical protein